MILYVYSKRNMANTSTTIKFLDEVIIKAISAIRKSQKRPDETRIYDSIKILLENCDIDDSLFWERMKYLEENEVIYNKPTKMEILFIFRKDRETTSPTDKAPVINSPNNSVATPPRPPTILRKNQQRKKNLSNSSKRKILKIQF